MKRVKKIFKKKKFSLVILGVVGSLLILGVNVGLVYPWFFGKGPANLGSIEVSYVSMARFIRDFFPHLSFGPFWYFGFPFHLFYVPLLPFLELVLTKLTQVELWQAYRMVSGAGLVLTPVTLFLFVWYLTRRISQGVLAALFYTFLPSLFYFILPGGEVAGDILNMNPRFFDPRRLVILARWGEGPHILSLAFLPLAGLFYLRALEGKKPWSMFLVAIFVGLTALSNAIGFYSLVLLLLAIFLAQIVQKRSDFFESLKISLLTAGLSYGLIAFWYNLSFITNFFSEGEGVLKNYINLFPWGWVLFIGVFMGLFYFFRNVVRERAIAVSFFWFAALFSIVYIYYVSASAGLSKQRIELAPQALRLITEVDMAFSCFLASLVGGVTSLMRKRRKAGRVIGKLGGVILVVAVLGYGFRYLPYAQKAVSKEVDLSKTGENEIARWFEDHVDQKKGERVYAAGNYSFYLNYFTNVWQLRGGLFQAMTHPWPDHIYYQVNNGKSREIAIAWLKASNVRYIVVNGPGTRELYKEFSNPQKFEGLEVVYKNGGDLIYEVPLKDTNSAKVVDLSILGGLKTPYNAIDKEALFTYVDWIEKPTVSEAKLRKIYNNKYGVGADLKGENEGILVQVTWDPGWRARAEGKKVRIEKDPLGFMVLRPGVGEKQIVLSHGPVWDEWVGYGITLGTLVFLGIFWSRRRMTRLTGGQAGGPNRVRREQSKKKTERGPLAGLGRAGETIWGWWEKKEG